MRTYRISHLRYAIWHFLQRWDSGEPSTFLPQTWPYFHSMTGVEALTEGLAGLPTSTPFRSSIGPLRIWVRPLLVREALSHLNAVLTKRRRIPNHFVAGGQVRRLFIVGGSLRISAQSIQCQG